MELWTTPKHKLQDFHYPITFDDKVAQFEARILGYQIDIAIQVADKIPHSGFGVLSILLSYFESIAKFEAGYENTDNSKMFFEIGVQSVYPYMSDPLPIDVTETALERLYKSVRCGMYHRGIIGKKVMLTGESDSLEIWITRDGTDVRVVINPHQLADIIKQHFIAYITKLRDPENTTLRANFERRYDYETSIDLG